MMPAHRQNLILERLERQSMVRVADLSREFGVTTETIRRDLSSSAKAGWFLVRTAELSRQRRCITTVRFVTAAHNGWMRKARSRGLLLMTSSLGRSLVLMRVRPVRCLQTYCRMSRLLS